MQPFDRCHGALQPQCGRDCVTYRRGFAGPAARREGAQRLRVDHQVLARQRSHGTHLPIIAPKYTHLSASHGPFELEHDRRDTHGRPRPTAAPRSRATSKPVALPIDARRGGVRQSARDNVPTIHRERGYRFHFFSDERQEPPHVHVQLGDGEAKLWLTDGALVYSVGLSAPQLRVVREIVAANRQRMLRAWDEYHPQTGRPGSGC